MIPEWMQASIVQLQKYGDSDKVIVVNIEQQKLYLLENNAVVCEYPISSSKYGVGCKQNSNCTPVGAHKIAEKIGTDCQHGEILKSRIATGEIATILSEPIRADEDLITSRVLWLEGLEIGVNCGGDVDSFERYIYIHGTAEEGLIGQPASIGCIRMKNDDVIELFQNVNIGTLLIIQ
jgi:lipoprotein-anchoring transpeptidase ErfK/SrfK